MNAVIPPRTAYTLHLRITTQAPLTHGSGTRGNQQVLLTREVPVQRGGKWVREQVPAVSGASIRSAIREHCVIDQLERLGVERGSVGLDTLRLLLKGGRNDSGGQTVSLDTMRELRALFPVLALFGAMDGGMPMRGLLDFSDVLPWCETTAAEGLVPTGYMDGDEEVPLWARTALVDDMPPGIDDLIAPMPDRMTRTEVTYYRHDMRSSEAGRFLDGAVVRALEDKGVEVKNLVAPKKEDRREANESMPHSMQAIAPNVPMYARIGVRPVTEVEWAALCLGIARWVGTGGLLGGGHAKGHGRCRVQIAGGLRHDSGTRAADSLPGVRVDPTTAQAHLEAVYDGYLAEHRDEILARVRL